MEWLLILEKGFWFGIAALGFAILFNVPRRTLFIIWALSAIGGLVKVTMLKYGISPVLASFVGASVIGILSIPSAHYKHTPPLIFSIPALIPFVPGAFAYRTMLGIMQLSGNINTETYQQLLHDTVSNGLKTFLIMISLAVGASIPLLVTRKASAKQLKIKINREE